MDFSKDKKDKVQYISKIAVPLLSVIALLNLSIIAFAPEAVMFFAPKSYYEAIWIIPSVAMSVYFMFMYSLFSNIEFYFEKTKLIALATALGDVINICFNYFLYRSLVILRQVIQHLFVTSFMLYFTIYL